MNINRYLRSFLPVIFLTFIFAANSFAQTSPTIPSKKAETGVPTQNSEWENVVAGAQKEQTVVIYSNVIPKARDALTAAFKKKFGINLEWVVGRDPELLARITTERRAGLNLGDVFITGRDLLPKYKEANLIVPLEPLFILPEVKDPKKWIYGEHPFYDTDKTCIAIGLVAGCNYTQNDNLVMKGEVTSSMDLLNPKWKQKIVVGDPTIPGNANSWFSWMLKGVYGMEKGKQYMKDFVSQKPMVTRNERQMIEWVARGKYAIGIGASGGVPSTFIQEGAPISFVDIKEPRYLSSGFSNLMAFNNPPHPGAYKLFINWLLSREGSTVYASHSESPSTRVDVSPEGIIPVRVPRQGDIDPYKLEGDYNAFKADMRKVSEDIFAELLK